MITRRRQASPSSPAQSPLRDTPIALRLLRDLMRQLGLWKSVLLITAIVVACSIGLVMLSNTVMAPPSRYVRTSLILSGLIPAMLAPPAVWFVIRLMLDADAARSAAERLAVIDPLTLAFNRRHFFEVGARAFDRARAGPAALSVLLLDIDEFKRVNDQLGHAAGDGVLTDVAQTCMDCMREHDLFARFGGEEFAVLLPDTDLVTATALAERLRLAVEVLVAASADEAVGHGPAPTHGAVAGLTITVSVGVTTLTPAISTLDGLLAKADQAMYAAKRGGRNRVVASGAGMQPATTA